MKSQGLDCNKIKKLPHLKKCCFINFRNEFDQKKALEIFNGFKFKNNILSVRTAKPSKDPLARKRKQETDGDRAAKKAKRFAGENSQPLGNLPYEEQLSIKQKQVEDIIEEFKRELKKANENQMQINIDLLPIVPSPQDIGYRNKVEFTVGWNSNKEISVGNRTGSYSQGDLEVEKAENLKIAPEKMKIAAKHFEDFVKSSKWEPFNPETSQGNWKQLTTRLNNDELMLIVGVNPQNLTPEDIQEIQDEIVTFFTSDERKKLDVKSIYFEDLGKRQPGQKCSKLKHIYGDTHIHDYLLGLCFRISPTSFFQVNTKAAEKLYQEIINFAGKFCILISFPYFFIL
jgi:tRNA (uracil-5-)-methyltransferase